MKNLVLFHILFSLFAPQPSQAETCTLPPARPEFLKMISGSHPIYSISESEKKTKNDCVLSQVEIATVDPLSAAPATIRAMSYSPKGNNADLLRTVLLVPPTGGENPLDRIHAEIFCARGMRVVILQHWTGDNVVEIENLEYHDMAMIRAISALETLVDYINPKNLKQLGIFGTSLGAIGSSLLLGVEYRISTAVLVVGGANLPDIVAHTNEPGLTNVREARSKLFGFRTPEEYRSALEKSMLIDPLNFIKWAKPKTVLSMIATKDITVPTANQLLLYEAFGKQQYFKVRADHIGAILHYGLWEKKNVADFLFNNLEESQDGDASLPGSAPCLNMR